MSLPAFPEKLTKPLAVMSFDFGTQRIGVAFGQSITGSAQGVAIIKARDGIPDWAVIENLISQWQPDVLVVGLPYNMDDSESELLLRARKFANRLHGRLHLPVFGMDERLSSKAAAEEMAASGGNQDEPIDHIAAKIILENWFAELARQAKS